MRNTLFAIFVIVALASYSAIDKRIDISGEWTIRLDREDVGIKNLWQGKLYDTKIQLPGTTDGAKLGSPTDMQPSLEQSKLQHLTRAYEYVGPAWYSKVISVPNNWSGKEIYLNLERVLWDTQVWIDGNKVEGHEESLISPHRYNLTPYLKCGKEQILTIRVNNSQRHDISVKGLAHAYTDHTQIRWNGILGDMNIEAVEKVRVAGVKLYPDITNNSVKAVVSLVNTTSKGRRATLSMNVSSKDGACKFATKGKDIEVKAGVSSVEMEYDMGNNITLWSEFTPYLYEATIELKASKNISSISSNFGMRQLEKKGNQMLMNNKPLFLRGTLECCIFPLTGTPPMDKKGWRKVFSSAKEYGLNHLRFHSWCPPAAAFEVADEMGFYLQIELPVWTLNIGEDKETITYLKEESDRIIANYGNHPSFCLWSLGNELQGDFSILSSMLDQLKAKDNRHLYTTTSFTFEEGHGVWPEANDDFFVTQWTKNGWVRGQGVFNQFPPSFDKDYRASIKGMEVPLITHEIGQYSVYPDLSEISKYTGILKPLNFMAVKNDLEKKGLLDKAPKYLMASGKLASLLYKEEIERALKTEGISGFQLLDLHDFPGQGTALVGLLNAFWDSKGIISGSKFREFCSPVVPLLRFPKAVYTNAETFEGEIELCNYGGEELRNQNLLCSVLIDGKSIKESIVKVAELKLGYNNNLGNISVALNEIHKATKLELCVRLEGTDYVNRWNIWVYPSNSEVKWGKVKYTRSYAEARKMLEKGETVLFNPNWKTMKGVEGKFVPVFWSPVHFPNQAGSMGVLCDPTHKALAEFPTDMHTDWQWWDLNINSTSMITDSINGGSPIVEMIDNFANNRRLASLYEGKVNSGKLILATFDLQTDLDNRPVAKQMLISLLKYMNDVNFNPAILSNFNQLEGLFDSTSNEKQSAEGIY